MIRNNETFPSQNMAFGNLKTVKKSLWLPISVECLSVDFQKCLIKQNSMNYYIFLLIARKWGWHHLQKCVLMVSFVGKKGEIEIDC